jgi:hypothetical protein
MAPTTRMVNADRMAIIVDEVAQNMCVDPGDVLALVGMYQPEDDAPVIWDSEGMLSDIATPNVWLQLNWQSQRSTPALYPSQ